MHGFTGVVSELGELDQVFGELLRSDLAQVDTLNVMEECGDVLWYITRLVTSLDCSLEKVARAETFSRFEFDNGVCLVLPNPARFYLHRLHEACGSVADVIKRMLAYDKPGDVDKMLHACADMLYALTCLAGRFGYSLEKIATANIAKLEMRNPQLRADPSLRDRALERETMASAAAA
jgi:NTP pyrophosphatase (non-canonical NTP hydrolase)